MRWGKLNEGDQGMGEKNEGNQRRGESGGKNR
jgi:hypothetical protein